jgi:hypothetical protein
MAQLSSVHVFYPAGYTGPCTCYDLRKAVSWWKDPENAAFTLVKYIDMPNIPVRHDTAAFEAAKQASLSGGG